MSDNDNKKREAKTFRKALWITFGIIGVFMLLAIAGSNSDIDKPRPKRFGENITPEIVDNLQSLILRAGYSCGEVRLAYFRQIMGGFAVECQPGHYWYEIKDVGGRWKVVVK